MRRLFLLLFTMLALSTQAQQKVYTLADWNLKDWDATKGELALNVSEYKLDFNHPLPYTDMQAKWRVKADLKCGTLGTEQVFVCKEGKASHLIGKNSLNGDISLGYDNTEHRFFVELRQRRHHSFRTADAGGTEQKTITKTKTKI